MQVLQSETVPIGAEADIALARSLVRERAGALGFSMLATTMVLTAASELGRNTLVHGGGGTMCLETVAEGDRRGLRMVFEDHGAGIEDLAQAMTAGFSTKQGMGLGLSGSKRLVDELVIISKVGEGTRVMVIKWT